MVNKLLSHTTKYKRVVIAKKLVFLRDMLECENITLTECLFYNVRVLLILILMKFLLLKAVIISFDIKVRL